MKRMIVILMLILLKVGLLHSQTVMVVDMVNGVEHNVELTTASKILFQSDGVVISPRTGNNNELVCALHDIRSMTFIESIINGMDTVEYPGIHVYPNPVADNLTIEGIRTSDLPLTVYSLDGSVVIYGRYYYGGRVNVSSLAPDTYLIQVGDYNCKFVKK